MEPIAEPPEARPRTRLPGWLMPMVRVIVTVVLMGMVLSGIKWDAFLTLLRNCDWRWWLAGLGVTALVLFSPRSGARSEPPAGPARAAATATKATPPPPARPGRKKD